MTCLAVIAPGVGGRSETFIHRHMADLHPGKTVVLANSNSNPKFGHWDVDCPKRIFSQDPPPSLTDGLSRRLRFARAYGESEGRRFLRKHSVDVVLGEYLDFAWAWWPGVQKEGIPFYPHAHGYDISSLLREEKWCERYLEFKTCSAIITMSDVSRHLLSDLGLPREKIHVIPYGIDVPGTAPKRIDGRDTVQCVAVGRMVSKKAPLITLKAFAEAYRSCPELRLEMVGDGALFSDADAFVRDQNLESAVTLHGAKTPSEVQEILAGADIFLQHSIVDPESGDTEGLPVSILEAMASGLPVVSTKHAGIPEAVVDGKTGVLVEEGDGTAMSGAIKRLAMEPALREEWGSAGWERARERFSWEAERESLRQLMGLRE